MTPKYDKNAYDRMYRQRRKDLHICAYCGKQDEDTLAGRYRCKACSEKENAKRRQKWGSDPERRERVNKARRDNSARMKKLHLCRSCKRADAYTVAGHAYCAECSERQKQDDTKRKALNAYNRDYCERRKELHLCEKCGKQDDYTLAGRRICKACAERNNARRKARRRNDPEYREKDNREKRDTYRWLKKNHYCRSCKKVDAYTLSGHVLCAECSAKKKTNDREKRRAYERRRRERMKEAGVCTICGKPLPTKGYHYLTCERCRAKDRERRRRRREASGAVSRAMYKELGLCVICGRPRIKDKLGYDGREILLCERCYANALKWAEAGRKAFEEKYGFTYRSWATENEFRAMKARKR